MSSRAWPRLFRTTAFKLTAIFLAVFTVFAAFLIGYIARNTSEILNAQMANAVDAELSSMELQYERGGVAWLARVVELRSSQPGASLYLVTDPDGQRIAGNVETVPADVLNASVSAPQDRALHVARRAGLAAAAFGAGARRRSFPTASGCWSAAT